MLEGLLDISRLDAGGVRAEITEFDVGDLLNSLLKQFAPVAAPRGIRLAFVPTRLRVRSDPRLLRRVLQNFIGNALRYTQSGSVVLGADAAPAHDRRAAGHRHGPGNHARESQRHFRRVPAARSAFALG